MITKILTGAESNSESKAKPVEKSNKQRYFEEQRKEWSDREIQMEMLYAQQILIDKMDMVRGNTNTLIWWLIAIPIISAILGYLLLGGIITAAL